MYLVRSELAACQRLAGRARRGDEQLIERLIWERTSAAVITPPGGTVLENWDGASIYTPVLCRNLDRTPYRDGDGNLYVYYNGDNTSPGDLDQVGLALGPTLATLTRYVAGNPVVPLGSDPSPDAGDAQVCSVWYTGTGFVMYYQGNASAPGSGLSDNVSLCYATSSDGKAWTKQGQILAQGSGDDSEDMYWHKLVPNAPGGIPRIYYAGKNGSNTFGLMCAVSLSGDLAGPWTRLSDSHLFRDGTTVLGDAWYDGTFYHFLYAPLNGSRGICYANSRDGVHIQQRGEIYTKRAGQWDENPYHASFVQDGGVNYLLMNSHAYIGIGYAYSHGS